MASPQIQLRPTYSQAHVEKRRGRNRVKESLPRQSTYLAILGMSIFGGLSIRPTTRAVRLKKP